MLPIRIFNLSFSITGTLNAIVVVGSPALRPHPALRGPSFGIPLGMVNGYQFTIFQDGVGISTFFISAIWPV
jgi:hypothetical protein